VRNLFSLSKQIFIATKQVAQVGTDRQLTEAKKVLTDTRRRLYLILAEDEAGGEQDAGGATRAWRLAETLEKKDQQNARTSVAAVAAALPAHRKCFLQNQLLPFSLTVG
jgi:hypothetical protein